MHPLYSRFEIIASVVGCVKRLENVCEWCTTVHVSTKADFISIQEFQGKGSSILEFRIK